MLLKNQVLLIGTQGTISAETHPEAGKSANAFKQQAARSCPETVRC
jgi:hypothetical protein